MNRKTLLSAAILLVAGCSTQPHTGTEVTQNTDKTGLTTTQASSRSILPEGGLAGEESELRQMTAKVEAIDLKTRSLSLKRADGEVVAIKVGEEVKNLPQVKKGDEVKLDYYESVAFEVREPTKEELAMSGSAIGITGKAPKGEKPAAIAAAGRISVLTIDSIDKKKELITLKGESGLVTVKAKYPQNLGFIKQGDKVVVTTSELFAARVQPVG